MTSAHGEKTEPPPPSLISQLRKTVPLPLAFFALTIYLAILLAISAVFFFKDSPLDLTLDPTLPNITYNRALAIDGPGHETWQPKPSRPFKRYHLGYGNQVACWQMEGAWVKDLEPLEMKAIGIDRFRDNERSLDQTEEDAFCAVLRTYGADFYPLPLSPHQKIYEVPPAIDLGLSTCFPEDGGVWLLDRTKYRYNWVLDLREPGHRNIGLGNALTMKERCDIFQKMGAKFCETLRDPKCPEAEMLVEKIVYKDVIDEFGSRRLYFLPGGQRVMLDRYWY